MILLWNHTYYYYYDDDDNEEEEDMEEDHDDECCDTPWWLGFPNVSDPNSLAWLWRIQQPNEYGKHKKCDI